jgi:hypothetical protein
VSQEAHSKSVPTGPDDSGVEVGLESEQEGLFAKHQIPVLFITGRDLVEEKGKTLEEAGVELSFGGSSIIEDKEPLNSGLVILKLFFTNFRKFF